MKRTFVAISLPPEILDQLEAAVRSLSELGLSGRGVRRSAMHLTLKFLGNVGEDKLSAVVETLSRLASGMPPFEVVLQEPDAFPHKKGARIVFVRVQTSPSLLRLRSEVEEKLGALGLDRESREYQAHLTLMRLRSPRRLSRLQDWFTRELKVTGMSFAVDHFHLYQSILKPSGAEYKVLKSFPLGREAAIRNQNLSASES